MNIEAVSGMDSVHENDWNDKEDVVRWNGRDLTTVHGNHLESRISSTALRRIQFNNAQTGYILCKNEKDAESRSENEDSDDKDSKSEIKQSLSVGTRYDRDDHGHSSNEAHGRYKASFNFENGTSLDVEAKVSHSHDSDRNDSRDRTSGEIDASYNF